MALTPLQINAGPGLLQNEGLSVNPAFTAALTAYNNTAVITPLLSAISLAAGGTGNVTANTLAQLRSIGSTTCPAFGDSVPTAYASLNPTSGFSNLLATTANTYMGNGDISKFIQAFNSAQSYVSLSSTFVNGAVNAQNQAPSFSNTNNMTSGGVTEVNSNPELFGNDLRNLGQLIDLSNLYELGTPLALLKQLAKLGGLLPQVSTALTDGGVSVDVVVNLNSPTLVATDTDQKLMYAAMTKITGDTLTQVLQVFGVTTSNINTMADLLNPVKIFPNSFQTLKVIGIQNTSVNIYTNAQGQVNPDLPQALPAQSLRTIL